jgi:hypothetical protein
MLHEVVVMESFCSQDGVVVFRGSLEECRALVSQFNNISSHGRVAIFQVNGNGAPVQG